MALEWKDPPPEERVPPDRSKWTAIADELRAHPGQWAIVAHNTDPSMVTNIKKGRYAAMPAGEFEATSRRTSKDTIKATIWARYVGGVTGE